MPLLFKPPPKMQHGHFSAGFTNRTPLQRDKSTVPLKDQVYSFIQLCHIGNHSTRDLPGGMRENLSIAFPPYDSRCVHVGRQKMPPTSGTDPRGFQRLGPSPERGSRIKLFKAIQQERPGTLCTSLWPHPALHTSCGLRVHDRPHKWPGKCPNQPGFQQQEDSQNPLGAASQSGPHGIITHPL